MMTVLTNALPSELVATHEPPCLSLYQPTHRHHPDNQQDPIRFKNLVKQLGASLEQASGSAKVGRLLEPFEALARDTQFWNHTLDGLAVLAAPDLFRVIRLQRSVPELAVVADSFHLKPLWRLLQSVDRYQVLALSRDRVRLFEGNRDALDEVDLAPGVPRTITEGLGEELTEPHQTVASYGGVGGASSRMHHGHGGRSDELAVDEERFFRVIDRAVYEHHSKPSGLPLVLAALAEHHHAFREVSHNPQLVSEGISINPEAIGAEQLRDRAWQVVEPAHQARLAALGEEFAHAKSNGSGSDDLLEVAVAAAAGRIATLFVDSDRQIGGRLDPATGFVELGELRDPGVDDLLDDLGSLVIKQGGRVIVIPESKMPGATGAAAIYRY